MKKSNTTTGFEPVDTFARSDDRMQATLTRATTYMSRLPQNIVETIAIPSATMVEQQKGEPTSDDPDDPQNWPTWHKHLTYGTICLFSFMANVNASVFTVAVRPLSMYFHISTTLATAMTALNVLMFGLGNILWVPLMRVVGKRPVYLLAIAILIAANAWSAKASSWGSLLASRMVSGIGASAADATVPSVVGDLYAHKERGHKSMFFHVALASGIFLGPLINAWVIQLHGWRWAPGWMSIVFAFLFLLALLFIHETEYRQRRQPLPRPSSQQSQPTRPRKFLSRLSLTLGLERHHPLQKATLCLQDIIAMLFYPLIFYPSILTGVFVGWTIILQITAGQTLTRPPYNFALGQVGLFHLAGFIGVLLAFPFAGPFLDYAAKLIKRKNQIERAHPRQRLLALIVPGLIAPAGLLIYGFQLAQKKNWTGPAVGYAMHSFGFAAVSNIVVVYAIDCYQNSAGEGFVSLFVIRNTIAVICSFYESHWVERQGMERMFGTMAGVEWALFLLGGLVWLYTPKLLMVSGRYGPEKRRLGKLNELQSTPQELAAMDRIDMPNNGRREEPV